ncbi:J domain-containing protein [Desulfosporosinus sp. Sb-LF]|uniref:J domain-containing protein n=1 Tax=Desulfosporosinus sp. Sb-LF TaxID=2560027 RepID=UPI00107EF2A8|nr:J domain-containing protein [Desulfosporosinus sp. Sb-LF]TGE31493.1 hypothetical protein E4K68_16565 [Desulfosporosinus sp. Sb-LF]
METTKPSQRRSRKSKPEDFYKNLGVRVNATQASIKQKYLDSVESFPPDTHPEKFQQICRAYETLRDPIKRREYDLIRKYSGKLEKIMEDVWGYVESEHYGKAETLIIQAFALMPDNLNLHLFRAYIALLKNDLVTFQEQFDIVEDIAPDNDKPMILVVKARMLLQEGHPEEAIQVLDEVRSCYPEQIRLLLSLYTDAYQDLDRGEDLWKLILTFVPAPWNEIPEDIMIFIYWLNSMFDQKQWSFKSKIQLRVRKLLKSVTNEDDKLMIIDALQHEHEEYFDVGRFREAELFIDLIYYIDSANPRIHQQHRQTHELARVQKEIKQLECDENNFPPLTFHALEWFYHDFWSPEELRLIRDGMLSFINDPAFANLEIDEMFVEGITYLRKRYPLVYRYFHDHWDELFLEHMQNLNHSGKQIAENLTAQILGDCDF